jgi:hypothetical protein
MKITKNRLVYDTERATLVAFSSCSDGTFQALYRKRTGKYFFYYCIVNSEGLKSEEIEPIDFETARNFSENYMNRSDFLQEFEPLPSAEAGKGRKKYISVYLPESLLQAATVKAHSEGTSLSVLVERLLLECIEKDGQK